MANDEPVVVWILTMETRLDGDGEPHYFYSLGASYSDVVHAMHTAGFQLAPGWPLDDGDLVRVGQLSLSRRRPMDNWTFGHAPHHYYLQGADRQATIDALLGVELQHATRITDAVEGALGRPWDIW